MAGSTPVLTNVYPVQQGGASQAKALMSESLTRRLQLGLQTLHGSQNSRAIDSTLGLYLLLYRSLWSPGQGSVCRTTHICNESSYWVRPYASQLSVSSRRPSLMRATKPCVGVLPQLRTASQTLSGSPT